MIEELVEEYAVERGDLLDELAQQRACKREHLDQWVRRNGFRTENGYAKR